MGRKPYACATPTLPYAPITIGPPGRRAGVVAATVSANSKECLFSSMAPIGYAREFRATRDAIAAIGGQNLSAFTVSWDSRATVAGAVLRNSGGSNVRRYCRRRTMRRLTDRDAART
jgi:hypothetical protein